MTRLTQDMIADMPLVLDGLDDRLKESTGFGLSALAARAAGGGGEETAEAWRRHRAAVIPVTSGEGVIPGFAEAVRAVLTRLGMAAEITEQSDVAGFGEAVRLGADILFAADDRSFLAINTITGNVTDNNRATALGFAQALFDAARKPGAGLAGKSVLVLGLGPVGTQAVPVLSRFGARVVVFDPDAQRVSRCLAAFPDVKAFRSPAAACHAADHIFDASPAAGFITTSMIRPDTVISAPGVPHGLTDSALSGLGARLIHDPLALGVAVMAACSVMPVSSLAPAFDRSDFQDG